MLLTLVPSPALDKTVLISGFEPGKTYRAAETLTQAGGKGLNFARVLRVFGQPSLVVIPAGGKAGEQLLELAHQEGLVCAGVKIAAEMRTCLTIIDPEAGYRLTELYEPGARLEPAEWTELVRRTEQHFTQARFLAVCGSFPQGTPEAGLSDLLARARKADLPVLLDTYGPQVAAALARGPALLKINQFEAGELVEQVISTPRQAMHAATALQQRGAREVVITLGQQGAVGVSATGQVFGWAAPQVPAISPIGSGDSLFAGLVAGILRGQSLAEALRLGVAAGAANTLQIGAGRLQHQQVETLLAEVQALAIEE